MRGFHSKPTLGPNEKNGLLEAQHGNRICNREMERLSDRGGSQLSAYAVDAGNELGTVPTGIGQPLVGKVVRPPMGGVVEGLSRGPGVGAGHVG